MSTSPISIESNSREEGEIVDDEDVFEDISDNSISNLEPYSSGKLISHKERLRALSLSSVSDVEVPEEVVVKHHHTPKCSRHRKRSKSEKRKTRLKHRRHSDHSSDSDDRNRPNKRLKRQLKEAVRISTPDNNAHHNSLRTRLRGMVKLGDDSDSSVVAISDEATLPPCPVPAVKRNVQNDLPGKEFVTVVNQDSGDDIDGDLTKLRLEALKTAIINKHKHRKKRKEENGIEEMVLSDSSQKSELLENKENDTAVNNTDVILPNKKPYLNTGDVAEKVDIPPSPVDEDADVLRALLLASMANKMASSKPKEETDVPEIQNKVIEIKSTVDMTVKTEVVQQELLPQVQVELKNVIGDGNNLRIATASKVASNKSSAIQMVKHINTVNKVVNNVKGNAGSNVFIRKTAPRNLTKHKFPQNKAVILPPVKPLIINLDADSDSEEDMFENIQQDVKVENSLANKASKVQKIVSKIEPPKEKVKNIVEKKVTNSKSVVHQKFDQKKVMSQDEMIKKTTEVVNQDQKELDEIELNKDDINIPPEIQESLEQLLKQERAKVEAYFAKKVTPLPAENKNPSLKRELTKLETGFAEKVTPLPAGNKNPSLTQEQTKVENDLDKKAASLPAENKDLSLKQERTNIEADLANDKTPVRTENKITNTKVIEKSVVKLLPKNKQIEYRNLIQQIKSRENGEKKVRQRKISQRMVEDKPVLSLKKITNKNKIMNKSVSKINTSYKLNSSSKVNAAGKINTSKLLKLQRTEERTSKKIEIEGFTEALRDMQFLSTGSLQVKGKYHTLSPLLDKITWANREKKKCELIVKRLMQELTDARSQFSRSLEKYMNLAKELVVQKNLIDGSKKQENFSSINYASSTPMKSFKVDPGFTTIVTTLSPVGKTVQISNLNQSKEIIKKPSEKVIVDSDKKYCNGTAESETLAEKVSVVNIEKIQKPESAIDTNLGTQKLDGVVGIVNTDLETQKSDDTVKIVSDFQERSELKTIAEELTSTREKDSSEEKENSKGVSVYVSPLGNYSRHGEVDPLAIFCPYEMSGSCRDPDCSYTHFSKSTE